VERKKGHCRYRFHKPVAPAKKVVKDTRRKCKGKNSTSRGSVGPRKKELEWGKKRKFVERAGTPRAAAPQNITLENVKKKIESTKRNRGKVPREKGGATKAASEQFQKKPPEKKKTPGRNGGGKGVEKQQTKELLQAYVGRREKSSKKTLSQEKGALRNVLKSAWEGF